MSEAVFASIAAVWFTCGVIAAICTYRYFIYPGKSFSGKLILVLFSMLFFFIPTVFLGSHIEVKLGKRFGEKKARYFTSFVIYSLSTLFLSWVVSRIDTDTNIGFFTFMLPLSIFIGCLSVFHDWLSFKREDRKKK